MKKKTHSKRKGGSILANIAKKTLVNLPNEKSFRFYLGLDRPTAIAANNLASFIDALKKVELASIQFHMSRGDFSKWLSNSLNDKLLAKNIASLKKLNGEALRKTIISRVENRYNSLKKSLNPQ